MGNIDDTNDAVWYGLHNDDNDYNGWKDVLKEDQYKVVKTDDGSFAKIDLENHTIYTQVRWIVRYRTNTEESETVTISSDWSAPACVGKDAAKTGPLKPGDIDAQVISDLRYTGEQFNNYPVIGFMPTEDNKLTSQLAQVNGTQGGIFLETEARVSGKNDWVQLQGDFTIKTGEMTIALQNLAEAEGKIEKDTPSSGRAITVHRTEKVRSRFIQSIPKYSPSVRRTCRQSPMIIRKHQKKYPPIFQKKERMKPPNARFAASVLIRWEFAYLSSLR